jgi:hypothetical protein
MSIYRGVSPDSDTVILVTGIGSENPEPTREQMRVDLALAMGWTKGSVGWFSPKSDGLMRVAQDEPPDPFTDGNDNRALVAWLADKREYRDRFHHILENDLLTERDGTWGYPVSLFYLTAPYKTIAEDVWRAIKEKQ